MLPQYKLSTEILPQYKLSTEIRQQYKFSTEISVRNISGQLIKKRIGFSKIWL